MCACACACVRACVRVRACVCVAHQADHRLLHLPGEPRAPHDGYRAAEHEHRDQQQHARLEHHRQRRCYLSAHRLGRVGRAGPRCGWVTGGRSLRAAMSCNGAAGARKRPQLTSGAWTARPKGLRSGQRGHPQPCAGAVTLGAKARRRWLVGKRPMSACSAAISRLSAAPAAGCARWLRQVSAPGWRSTHPTIGNDAWQAPGPVS